MSRANRGGEVSQDFEARYGTVSFLSDFGHVDEFVGVVHSVIASIAPDVRIVDITHGIAPHDVRAGGLALARAAQYLNPGVVVAVVDPGVGSNRRAVAIEVGDGASVLVGPDNGLLALAVALVGGATRAVEITNEELRLPALGSTFDGRDVFAPAAAHLCNGVPLADLGAAVDPAALMPGMLPLSRMEEDDFITEILWVDRYGNCQLNAGPDDLVDIGPTVHVVSDDDLRTAAVVGSYDQISDGRIGLITDSSGLIAIAVNRGSAAQELGLHAGSEIRLRVIAPEESPSATGVSTPVELGQRSGGDA